jgi:hypothetical protein
VIEVFPSTAHYLLEYCALAAKRRKLLHQHM